MKVYQLTFLCVFALSKFETNLFHKKFILKLPSDIGHSYHVIIMDECFRLNSGESGSELEVCPGSDFLSSDI